MTIRRSIHAMALLTLVLAAVAAEKGTTGASGKNEKGTAAAADKEADSASRAARKDVGVDEFEKLWLQITAQKGNEAAGKPGGMVLDVRTPKEFAAGHIPGAVNLDVNSPDFDKKVK